ncbi:MAG: FKBP-type peptidyl-prolyl cis-trans isomerase [Phycisphaerales bacterium]|nr:FKBP-type peptidyl-prolyl cis-trans isomerase [Phycisphaerales bacterium]
MSRTASIPQRFIAVAALIVSAGLAAATLGDRPALPSQTAPDKMAPDKADASYAIGFETGRDLARSLKDDAVDLDRAALIAGLTDGLNGAATRLSEAEMKRILTELHRRVAESRAEQRYKTDPVFRALADANAARAKSLIDQLAAVQGARKLDSGVVYRIVRAGEGEPAGQAATVIVTFHASLADGRQVAHGVELEVDTAGLLPGARSLIAAMHPGERVSAVIPPAAAFGLAGRDDEVGPNEPLLVEAELISIKK